MRNATATLAEGQIVTTKVTKPMEYFGYWAEPNTLYEYFRPGDIGIVTYNNIKSGKRPGHTWCWVEFVRTPYRNILRVQLHDDEAVAL